MNLKEFLGKSKRKSKKSKRSKSYEIIKASRRPWSEFSGIGVDKKYLKFGRRTNALRIRDGKLAKDIKQALGDEVVVIEVDDVAKPGEKDSKSFFSVPNLPWKK